MCSILAPQILSPQQNNPRFLTKIILLKYYLNIVLLGIVHSGCLSNTEEDVMNASKSNDGGIIAPPGGRIYVVSVPVDESRDWHEAIGAAGPSTGSDWDIERVGEQYPTTDETPGSREVILVNFGKKTGSEDNLVWAKAQQLRPASPRTVFAVGEYCPTLHNQLDMDPLVVVSLITCFFEGEQRVVSVGWIGPRRAANLGWFEESWQVNFWFASIQESRQK